jgi:hypothetical protein
MLANEWRVPGRLIPEKTPVNICRRSLRRVEVCSNHVSTERDRARSPVPGLEALGLGAANSVSVQTSFFEGPICTWMTVDVLQPHADAPVGSLEALQKEQAGGYPRRDMGQVG